MWVEGAPTTFERLERQLCGVLRGVEVGKSAARAQQFPATRLESRMTIRAMTGTTPAGQRRTTQEAIVTAALELIDEVGIDRLTMRKLARAVKVPPMSLYLHFPSKEKLLDLMYQEVARRLYTDPEHDGLAWQAGLSALCHRTRSMFLAHPEWVPLLARPATPEQIPLRELLLSQMVSAGIPAKDALSSMASVNFVALGLALGQLAFRNNLTSLLAQSVPPSMVAPSTSDEELFTHTTQALIAGLTARLMPVPSAALEPDAQAGQ
jgi:AcrR family transcriptional regulator